MKRFLLLVSVALVATLLLPLTPANAASAAAGSPFPAQNWPGGRQPSPEKPKPPTKDGTTDKLVVQFTASADLGQARAVPGWTARGSFVADSLQAQSAGAQDAALKMVRSRGAKAESFWISNAIVVQGADQSLRSALAALPGVKSVRAERTVPLIEPVDMKAAVTAAAGDPEWGVAKINAPGAWEQGVTGSGVVVATIDSGVQYDHPALVSHYRGNKGDGTFDHNYNWYDAAGVCGSTVPCDLHGHGTHTMGTIVGGDGPGPFTPDVGVAPGATWMSSGCGPFFCSESQILRAGQFMLEPFDSNGANPDASKRPHLVSNSWGYPPGDSLLVDVVKGWRSAGIVPVFAAGNEGPTCGTTRSPGDYPESFTVGATDINDNIAFFSSRGPSIFGGVGKPQVSAPGVDVISSVPGNGYGSSSGTSMATPHVAGALALALSAAPALQGDVAGSTDALAKTAIDFLDDSCGGDPDGDPNNTFGEGRIDALAAVNLVATGGTLTGAVTDAGRPVAGAKITATGGSRPATTVTKPDGTYSLLLTAGTYTIKVEAFGYETVVRENVVIREKETVTLNFALTPATKYKVTGTVVRAENGKALPGATIEAIGVPIPPVISDASGRYELTVPAGTYTLKASQAGCVQPRTIEVVIRGDQVLDFRLAAKTDKFGHGCSPTTYQWIKAKNQTALYGDDSYGRLRLPFAFPFYGQTYQDLFVSTNGALSFVDPQYANSFNTGIPEVNIPNAAIYPLWQNLTVTGDAVISYDTLNKGQGGSSFVVSYDNVQVSGGSAPVSFQVRLHQDGTIDITYGDMAGVNEGAQATIGLEDPTGTDGLQFGFRERVARSNTAWRYSEITSATVNGSVLDNNDGQGIAAATVTADPGGRTATTDATGRYSLKLVPGRYRLTATKPGYESAFIDVNVKANTILEAKAMRLKAPAANISPTSLSLSSTYGQTVEATVTVSNPGTAPLNWSVRDRERVTPTPAARLAGAPVIQPPGWGVQATRPQSVPTAIPGGYHAAPTDTIIEDPVGDATRVDATTIGGGSDGEVMSMNIGFTPSTPMNDIVGYVLLDTDQNRATGRPATDFSGKPTQDVGADYYISLWGIHNTVPVIDVYRTDTFQLVASPPAKIEGQSILFDVPLNVLGTAEDGNIDTDLILGDFSQPLDWAPDVGHGTMLGQRDAPWLDAQPASGVIPPGGSAKVTVRAGGPALLPGTYKAELQFSTNAPRNPNPIVPVTLTVTLPANYGTVLGQVTDARGNTPIKGATVSLVTAGAEPTLAKATTDANGRYKVYGPQGAATVTVEAEKYRSETRGVTITAGTETTLDVALRPLEPVAVIGGAPVELTVTAGSTASGSITVGNEGLVDLQYEIRERAGAPTAASARSAGQAAGSGQYLYRRAPVQMRANNAAGTGTAQPSAYRWTPATATPAADARILVYADDPYHPSPNTYTDQALQRLGLPYTAHYNGDFSGFMSDLNSGQWDVVIFANDNWFPDASLIGPLRTYVQGGGSLIMHTWAMGFVSGEPIWADLGVRWVSDDNPPPDPIHWWDPSHPAVTTPEDAPEQITRQDGRFFYAGQHVEALAGTEAVAGYTDSGPVPGEAALVIGNDGRTVFRGIMDGVSDADDDADGVPDGAELWVNLIEGVQTGFASDVPWLTTNPATGTVVPGASAPVTVTVDASSLTEGTYAAELFIVTNDPRARVHRVPVAVTVLPAATTASGPGAGAPVPQT